MSQPTVALRPLQKLATPPGNVVYDNGWIDTGRFYLGTDMRLLILGVLAFSSLYPYLVAAADVTTRAERNIILFITDDQGTTLGCYGDSVAVTPHLDRLARDGTRFSHAFATTASCSASRSVVLSGLHNHKNGQYGHQHHFHKFASYHNVVSLSLPRVLARAGYRTARCGKFHVAPEIVYQFDETIPGNPRNPVKMANNCRDFLTADSDRPFFLYFATSDPHRGGGIDATSELELKPNLFGNKKERGAHAGIQEVFYQADEVPVPKFLPDTPETRAELAQYYQSCSRIDTGLGRLVEILQQADLFDRTLILFTSDHGMAFAGGKTTVYDPGLKVPFIVRDPYQEKRGVVSEALISHVDITPSLLDFAGGLDRQINGPADWQDPDQFWQQRDESVRENRSGGNEFRQYQGKSWLPILGDADAEHHADVFASHTFHEIQMYYPMRVVRDKKFKLIWNIAHKLDYPFASDLWAASSWQAQLQKGQAANYGQRTVGQYIQRPRFELFDIEKDPDEAYNLADKPEYAQVLKRYQERMKQMQAELKDPWAIKWKYE
ncbi:MAG: sulfatase [Mariniblastus sp.]|nr:sulfatase [Mariniblastus sp.]